MKIEALQLGPLGTNCYLVWDDEKNAAVIDPGGEPEVLLERIDALGLRVGAILLTHGHFDHVGATGPLMEKTGADCWLNDEDLSLPDSLRGGLTYNKTYAEGDTVQVGTLTFTVLATHGHTPGSVCLRCGDALFTGDTLFAGSCGRVDLPGGNNRAMRRSLDRLAALSEDLQVYPGHGPSSTLAREQRTNPYLRGFLV